MSRKKAWRQRVAEAGLRQDWGPGRAGAEGEPANGRGRRWTTALLWGLGSLVHRRPREGWWL